MSQHNTSLAVVIMLLLALAGCKAPQPASGPTGTLLELAPAKENFLPASPAWSPAEKNQHYSSSEAAQIIDHRAPEISGIAASNLDDNIFWAINDSGNGSSLMAFSRSGKLQANWPTILENRDWEDLASFTHNGHPYLLVAETGDNRKVYPGYALHIFNEPAAGPAAVPGPIPLVPITTLRFVYPDGAHNSEAVAVSEVDNSVIIVTKDADSAGIYSLPLLLDPEQEPVTATKLGNFPALPQSPGDGLIAKLTGIDFAVATALDINPQGNTAVLLSYREVYRWTRQSASQPWAEVLAQAPHKLLRHSLRQAEAMSFDRDGQNILVVSEGLPTPLLLLQPSALPATAANPF